MIHSNQQHHHTIQGTWGLDIQAPALQWLVEKWKECAPILHGLQSTDRNSKVLIEYYFLERMPPIREEKEISKMCVVCSNRSVRKILWSGTLVVSWFLFFVDISDLAHKHLLLIFFVSFLHKFYLYVYVNLSFTFLWEVFKDFIWL
jgi:hypothetical protein